MLPTYFSLCEVVVVGYLHSKLKWSMVKDNQGSPWRALLVGTFTYRKIWRILRSTELYNIRIMNQEIIGIIFYEVRYPSKTLRMVLDCSGWRHIPAWVAPVKPLE